LYNYLKTKMFRIAILTRPYQVPYTSYAGKDKTDILSNNFSGTTAVNGGMAYFKFTKTFSGRPLGQQ